MATQLNNHTVSQYAGILLAYAIEHKEVESIKKGVSLLLNQFSSQIHLNKVLNNPAIVRNKKKDLLALTVKQAIHPSLWRFIEIVLNQGKIGLLKEMLTAFELLYDQHQGIKSATLVTAICLPKHLTDKLIQKAKKLFTCQSLKLTHQIDPSIIGGYILKTETFKLDRSIRNDLNLLKNYFQ